MYAYIYAFLYQLGLRKGHSIRESEDNGVVGLIVASGAHLLLTSLFIEWIWGFDLLQFLPKGNKYLLVPFVILQSVLVYYWCKKRGQSYINKYNGTNLLTFKNSILVVLLIFGPVVMICLFVKGGYFSLFD